MNTNKKYRNIAVFLFCVIAVFAFGACQTTRNQTHKATKYQKVRTRHTPKWNSTTSQSTTYYIKKNSFRKSHDSKRIKR